MKQIAKYMGILLLAGVLLSACEDMFDVNSDRYINLDDNTLSDPNDSLYSMLGILKQLRDLNDRYVVLNELRGDLMDVSEYADIELQNISNFKTDISNRWIWARDYYTVINSCNYLIDRAGDTISNRSNLLFPEIVQAKTIRAWVYLQLLTNYGKAVYLDKPLVTLEDAKKGYPFSGYEEILPKLIEDLEPWTEIRKPQYGTIGTYNSAKLFLNTRFVLGDLYLWNREYLKAAQIYYDLISESQLTVQGNRSTWDATGQTAQYNWNSLFTSVEGEWISIIGFDESFSSSLLNLTTGSPMLIPSANYVSFTKNQLFSDLLSVSGNEVQVTKEGDLRGEGGAYLYPRVTTAEWSNDRPLINKYSLAQGKVVYLYRATQLYLRYAEAVNQLNKPTLALAVLNVGLNSTSQNTTLGIIEASEITPMENWFNFTTAAFNGNIGTRQRGLGLGTTNRISIPPFTADSIRFVEEALRDELALEMAFEGCRFPDLIRMARHRNDPALLADAVAKKHPSDPESMRSFLMQEQNWYFPYPDE